MKPKGKPLDFQQLEAIAIITPEDIASAKRKAHPNVKPFINSKVTNTTK